VIESPRAKERQLRVVRNMLRGAPWAALRAQLDELRMHGRVGRAATSEGREREWVVRLLGEGEVGLDALLAEHPSADRKHLRQLVRTIERSTPERRGRAEAKLASTLRLMLERG
jgi:ribosome-associated protein